MSSSKERITAGLALVALVVLIVFIAVNFREVEIDFVITQANVKLAFALMLAAILGFLAGIATRAFRS